VRVPLDAKELLLASEPTWCFTTPHFHGYPAILVHLPKIRVPDAAPAAHRRVRQRGRGTAPAAARRAYAPRRTYSNSPGRPLMPLAGGATQLAILPGSVTACMRLLM
jgi:hypothetical protein